MNSFIKVTDKTPLTSQQKALLNRKGNGLFNEGDIAQARKIFAATGYSDGLTRVGDHYLLQGNIIEALQLYDLAKNKRKTEPVIYSLVAIVRLFLNADTPKEHKC